MSSFYGATPDLVTYAQLVARRAFTTRPEGLSFADYCDFELLPLMLFEGEWYVNYDSVRCFHTVFLTNPVTRVFEEQLKANKPIDFAAMAAVLKTIAAEQAAYLCACACSYLSDADFEQLLRASSDYSAEGV